MAAPMSLAFGDRVIFTDPQAPDGSPSMPMSGEIVDAEDGLYAVTYDAYRHLPESHPARCIAFSEDDVRSGALVLEHEYLARPSARRPWTGGDQ